MNYLLALDQGTSSSRAMLFDPEGRQIATARQSFPQHYPMPGWVEHDPMDIWHSQLSTAREVLARAGASAQQVRAIGVTNQRESTLVWDRASGLPVYPAIVWQDRRTEPDCARLREQGLGQRVLALSGLVLDPYFSATKIAWILRHTPNGYQRAQNGELAFGTVDTWLIHQLTGGQVHATDVSNASRTQLMNLETGDWDDELLAVFGVPIAMLPEIRPSAAHYGHTQAAWLGAPIELAGVAGDQQSALFGQGCLRAGQAKNTYGTGCFMLMHTGNKHIESQHGLLSTAAAQSGHEPAYALEGSVFMAGAVVQWLRDGLGLIRSASDIETLAAEVSDTDGVMLVPAFTGLGAPYWDAQARGAILGLTRGTTAAHIARAALEGIALQNAAVLRAMNADALAQGSPPLSELRVDGGACANDLLMQMQADLLGLPLLRPKVIETTAWGAACLAALHSGVFSSQDDFVKRWESERVFEPRISRDLAQHKLDQWERAVRQTRQS
ncbi:MAG: glycerol kinase GlpK [Alphaproteobacteria bacterium]|nr:glycerol kinase GlpK [Alphaproteobacteria bacterium]